MLNPLGSKSGIQSSMPLIWLLWNPEGNRYCAFKESWLPLTHLMIAVAAPYKSLTGLDTRFDLSQ